MFANTVIRKIYARAGVHEDRKHGVMVTTLMRERQIYSTNWRVENVGKILLKKICEAKRTGKDIIKTGMKEENQTNRCTVQG